MPRRGRNKIGLLGPLTNGNLGNAAFEAAVVQHIHSRFREAEIYGCCVDSLDALKEYKVRLFPLRKDMPQYAPAPGIPMRPRSQSGAPSPQSLRQRLQRLPVVGEAYRAARGAWHGVRNFYDEIAFWVLSYRFLCGFRLLILRGGGQLSDSWGGPWKHPYTLFTWSMLARLSRTPFIVLSVGREGISSPLSRWLLRHALQGARYRSYRDEETKKMVEKWGIKGRDYLYPDLAFSLQIPTALRRVATPRQRVVVGISPMPYCDPRVWPIKDQAAYQRYLRTLASFSIGLIERGYEIILFASQVLLDPPVVSELKALILAKFHNDSRAELVSEAKLRTVDDFLSLIPKFDFVVASRLHGLLLSQLMYTPALAISYDPKVEALMVDLGLREFCVDIEKIDTEILTTRFSSLEAKRHAVCDALRERVTKFQAALQEQYDVVFRC